MSDRENHDSHVIPDYRTPRDDDWLRGRRRGQMWLGGILTAGAVIGIVFIWIISNIKIHPTSGGAGINWAFPSIVTIGLVATIVAIGLHIWFKEKSRAFFAGAAIGLGVGALIEGVCFARMM